MQETTHEPDYTAQWQDLKRRICLFWLFTFGGFAGMVLLGNFLGNKSGYAFPVFLVLWYAGGWRWSLFPCPRCGKPFFKPNAWSVNQLLNRCPHCGLQKWTSHDQPHGGMEAQQ